MIPKNWKMSTIGELCQIVKGISPTMKTKPGPFPLITMGEEHKTSFSYQLDTEAVCVPMISSFGHGKAGLKRVHYINGKFALSNILTALIVKRTNELSTRYLALYLQTFKDQLIVPLQTGAANMSLRPEKLAGIPVYYPELREQERIVLMNDSVGRLSDLHEKSVHRSSDLIPLSFYDFFGDLQGKSRWEKLPLEKLVLEMQPGFAQKPTTLGQGIPQIRPMNITSTGFLTLDGTKSIPCTATQLEKYRLKKQDVIFNNTNSPELVGKSAIFVLDGVFVFSNHMTRIRPDTRYLHPYYLATYLHLLWSIGYFKNLCTQWINQAAINKDELSKTLIAVPPIPLQIEFLNRVNMIRDLEMKQRNRTERITILHEAMIANAFGGTL